MEFIFKAPQLILEPRLKIATLEVCPISLIASQYDPKGPENIFVFPFLSIWGFFFPLTLMEFRLKQFR